MMKSRRMGSFLGWGAVVAMWLSGTTLLVWTFWPRHQQTIDTRYESGTHLLMVFAAPTSPVGELHDAVLGAKSALRSHAQEHGYMFSTVGISNQWLVREGFEQLQEYGDFDEVIIGRNWLNTGVGQYIRPGTDRAAVPQLRVLLQEVIVGSVGPRVDEPKDIIRLTGTPAILDWAGGGYVVQGK